jgi:hypothetical protein
VQPIELALPALAVPALPCRAPFAFDVRKSSFRSGNATFWTL